MNHNRCRAKAPATVANVACGFDVFGFALEHPCDEVVAEKSATPGATLVEMSGQNGALLPQAPTQNTATVAVNAMLQALHSEQGIALRLHKGLPLSSGLGSSAASAVAALLAANALLGTPFTRRELLPFAVEAERVACGTGHADNVAPSLLGGFVLIRSYEPLDVVSIPTPQGLCCAILHPHLRVRTEDARRVIKKTIPLALATQNWGNAAALIAGLYANDFALIGRSLEDHIFEPDRAPLVPGFYEMKQAALDAGALGCSLSGSGPSLFALCEGQERAQQVGKAMHVACEAAGLKGETIISHVNVRGGELVEA